jgi:hypothetical protein
MVAIRIEFDDETVRTAEGIEEAPWIDVEGLTPRRREESQRGYP